MIGARPLLLRSLQKVDEYFGAQTVPHRDVHEQERALQRLIVAYSICLIWLIELLAGYSSWSVLQSCSFISFLSYATSAFVYRIRLRRRSYKGSALQYFYLVVDPMALVLVMFVDPARFAFLNPFILIVIIRCGIRFGTRTMWLVWSVAILTSVGLLPNSGYWRNDAELALSFSILLCLIPALFIPLIDRVHKVRAIEEERARLYAVNQEVTLRSAFLLKVSHELRSPLQSIISALDVFEMRHGHGIVEDEELIGRMRRSSLLLNTQLRDLLTLAKGDAGHLEMHSEPFDACGLVEAVGQSVRESAQAKGLELRVTTPDDALFAVADGARLDQVLTNLVLNAVRYTDSGTIQLTLHPYDTTSRQLHLSVADTGPGIPPEVLPHLFEPDRLQNRTPRKGEGSGIGLAVVRTLVDHLGGTVSVASAEGVGTTFELFIPAEPIDADGAPDDDETAAEAETDDAAGERRVLVVDDRRDILEGLTSVLSELGYESDCAETIAVATHLLGTRRYDVVLFDIQMPGKSGADLAAETRAGNGPNRHARLLGMSAAEVTAAYADGPFDACLTKPIDRNALAGVLRPEWSDSWPAPVSGPAAATASSFTAQT